MLDGRKKTSVFLAFVAACVAFAIFSIGASIDSQAMRVSNAGSAPERLDAHSIELSVGDWARETFSDAPEFAETSLFGEAAVGYSAGTREERYSMTASLVSPELTSAYDGEYALRFRYFTRQREELAHGLGVYWSGDGEKYEKAGETLCYYRGSDVWTTGEVEIRRSRFIKFEFVAYFESPAEGSEMGVEGLILNSTFELVATPEKALSPDDFVIACADPPDKTFAYTGAEQRPKIETTYCGPKGDRYAVIEETTSEGEAKRPIDAGKYELRATAVDSANNVIKTVTFEYEIAPAELTLNAGCAVIRNEAAIVLFDPKFTEKGTGRTVTADESGAIVAYAASESKIRFDGGNFATESTLPESPAESLGYIYKMKENRPRFVYDGTAKDLRENIFAFSALSADARTCAEAPDAPKPEVAYYRNGAIAAEARAVGEYSYSFRYGSETIYGEFEIERRPITKARYPKDGVSLDKPYDGTTFLVEGGKMTERISALEPANAVEGDDVRIARIGKTRYERPVGRTHPVASGIALAGKDAGNYCAPGDVEVLREATIRPTEAVWAGLADKDGNKAEIVEREYDGTTDCEIRTEFDDPNRPGETIDRSDAELDIAGANGATIRYRDVGARYEKSAAGVAEVEFFLTDARLFDRFLPRLIAPVRATGVILRRAVSAVAVECANNVKEYDGNGTIFPSARKIALAEGTPALPDGIAEIFADPDRYAVEIGSAEFDDPEVGEDKEARSANAEASGTNVEDDGILRNYRIETLSLKGAIRPRKVELLTECVRISPNANLPELRNSIGDPSIFETRIYDSRENAEAGGEAGRMQKANRISAPGAYFLRVDCDSNSEIVGARVIPLIIAPTGESAVQRVRLGALDEGMTSIAMRCGARFDFEAEVVDDEGRRIDSQIKCAAKGDADCVELLGSTGALRALKPGRVTVTMYAPKTGHYAKSEEIAIEIECVENDISARRAGRPEYFAQDADGFRSVGFLPPTPFPRGYYVAEYADCDLAPIVLAAPSGVGEYFVRDPESSDGRRSLGILPPTIFPNGYFVRDGEGFLPATGDPDPAVEYYALDASGGRRRIGTLPETPFPVGYCVKIGYAPAEGETPDANVEYYARDGEGYVSLGALPQTAFPEGYFVREYFPCSAVVPSPSSPRPDPDNEYFVLDPSSETGYRSVGKLPTKEFPNGYFALVDGNMKAATGFDPDAEYFAKEGNSRFRALGRLPAPFPIGYYAIDRYVECSELDPVPTHPADDSSRPRVGDRLVGTESGLKAEFSIGDEVVDCVATPADRDGVAIEGKNAYLYDVSFEKLMRLDPEYLKIEGELYEKTEDGYERTSAEAYSGRLWALIATEVESGATGSALPELGLYEETRDGYALTADEKVGCAAAEGAAPEPKEYLSLTAEEMRSGGIGDALPEPGLYEETERGYALTRDEKVENGSAPGEAPTPKPYFRLTAEEAESGEIGSDLPEGELYEKTEGGYALTSDEKVESARGEGETPEPKKYFRIARSEVSAGGIGAPLPNRALYEKTEGGYAPTSDKKVECAGGEGETPEPKKYFALTARSVSTGGMGAALPEPGLFEETERGYARTSDEKVENAAEEGEEPEPKRYFRIVAAEDAKNKVGKYEKAFVEDDEGNLIRMRPGEYLDGRRANWFERRGYAPKRVDFAISRPLHEKTANGYELTSDESFDPAKDYYALEAREIAAGEIGADLPAGDLYEKTESGYAPTSDEKVECASGEGETQEPKKYYELTAARDSTTTVGETDRLFEFDGGRPVEVPAGTRLDPKKAYWVRACGIATIPIDLSPRKKRVLVEIGGTHSVPYGGKLDVAQTIERIVGEDGEALGLRGRIAPDGAEIRVFRTQKTYDGTAIAKREDVTDAIFAPGEIELCGPCDAEGARYEIVAVDKHGATEIEFVGSATICVTRSELVLVAPPTEKFYGEPRLRDADVRNGLIIRGSFAEADRALISRRVDVESSATGATPVGRYPYRLVERGRASDGYAECSLFAGATSVPTAGTEYFLKNSPNRYYSIGALPSTAFPVGYYVFDEATGAHARADSPTPEPGRAYFARAANGEFRSLGVLPATAFPVGYYVPFGYEIKELVGGSASVVPLPVDISAESKGHAYRESREAIAEISPVVRAPKAAGFRAEELEALCAEVARRVAVSTDATTLSDAGDYPIDIVYSGDAANFAPRIIESFYSVRRAQIFGVEFPDVEALYDGKGHKAEIRYDSAQWPNLKVDYGAAPDAKAPGRYECVATITNGPNYAELILTASLVIGVLRLESSAKGANYVALSLPEDRFRVGVSPETSVALVGIADPDERFGESLDRAWREAGKDGEFEIVSAFSVSITDESGAPLDLGLDEYAVEFNPGVPFGPGLALYAETSDGLVELEFAHSAGRYSATAPSLSGIVLARKREKASSPIKTWGAAALALVAVLACVAIAFGGIGARRRAGERSLRRHRRWV